MRYSLSVLIFVASLFLVGCNSNSANGNQESSGAAECVEPQNPYDEGSGHHAGYEWAEEKDSGICGGNSQAFIEGCEEYQRQESEYEDCEAKKH
jgi:hypothetical protein